MHFQFSNLRELSQHPQRAVKRTTCVPAANLPRGLTAEVIVLELVAMSLCLSHRRVPQTTLPAALSAGMAASPPRQAEPAPYPRTRLLGNVSVKGGAAEAPRCRAQRSAA